jgi:hypothetical protein
MMSASADPPYPSRIHAASAAPAEVEQQTKVRPSTQDWPWVQVSPAQIALAIVFGLCFGFLLQKGGVAKFDILAGVLLLEDFTVVKVMLSAIVTGMVGVYALHRLGVLEFHIKETVYGANILGGLIFGVGFGLIAYCPGTDAAAVGQGNLDALVGTVGLTLGSYLFALSSKFSGSGLSQWGQRGKITLPEMIGVSRGAFVAIAVPMLIGVLMLLEIFVG